MATLGDRLRRSSVAALSGEIKTATAYRVAVKEAKAIRTPRPPEVVVASGYFDPLHYGHIEYLQRSRESLGGLGFRVQGLGPFRV